jgi:hypothetical protein
MDTIKLEGVTYKKASIVAKDFRYTTDYIGQLCRGGKIDCQLVGRAWYVSEESLLAHKEGRYKETRPAEKTLIINAGNEGDTSFISVNSRLRGAAAKQILGKNSGSVFTEATVGSTSKYYSDTEALLPQPLKSPKVVKKILPVIPTKLPIVQAESEKIKVKVVEKPIKKLHFTEIPEIPLSGLLKVERVSVPEAKEPVLVSEEDINPVRTKTPSKINDKVSGHRIGKTMPSTFIPSSVTKTAPVSLSTRFLIPLALVSGVTLFVFLISASEEFSVWGKNMSAAVFFSVENWQATFDILH